jgi:ABC-type sugar transport system permease subunit
MLYREAGQFKTSYAADQQVFPILQDRIGFALIMAIALVAVPLLANEFVLSAIAIPFLVLALATIGLNVLTGYAGQLSLGTGGFMGVGAYACYMLVTLFPDVNVLILVLLWGLAAAAAGVVFGLPSLRIKGLYLAVTTLAAQFFFEWCFIRVPWLYNYNASGAIEVPGRSLFGVTVVGPSAGAVPRYYVVLAVVVVMTIWKTVGLAMLVLITGMDSIPPEVYEAAKLDGARAWTTLTRITLPLIVKPLSLVILLTVTTTFLAFDQFYTMTKGGPDGSTVTVVYYLYNAAFVALNRGYAAAVAVVVVLIMAIISIAQVQLQRGRKAKP